MKIWNQNINNSFKLNLRNLSMSLRLLLICGSLLTASLSSLSAHSEIYPNRPIRFIVPFPAAGGTDTVARLIAAPLAEKLKQQIVIDNRAGANAIIGTDIAAKSAPDGYTWVFCLPASMSINPTIYKKLTYNPTRDFTPVIQLNTIAMLVAVTNGLPVKSVDDLIALAKSKPGQLNYASSGTGSSGHLAIELLNTLTGTKMAHIAYKGGAPALTDLISGQVQIMSGPLIGAIQHVKSGRIRALAVTTNKRAVGLPDVPTISESVKGYESSIWHGVLMPAGVSKTIVNQVNREINEVLKISDVKERLATQGAEPAGGSPEEFTAWLRNDIERQSKLLKQIGLAGSLTQ
jgi:tripartite-type tricarboxylate transporter receptor subunit TctC